MPYTQYSTAAIFTGSNYDAYKPVLAWNAVGTDVTMNGTPMTNLVIPMVVQAYNPPTHTQNLTTQTLIPIYSGTFAYGGSFLTAQGGQYPIIQVQGFMDTPLVETTETDPRTSPHNIYAGTDVFIPALQVNGNAMHYTDVIAMFFEGRYDGTRKDPSYFTDPYGRVFDSPRISDITAQGVAGAPGRYNFTLNMFINESAI